jgi:hypothetical protein
MNLKSLLQLAADDSTLAMRYNTPIDVVKTMPAVAKLLADKDATIATLQLQKQTLMNIVKAGLDGYFNADLARAVIGDLER